jgi:hypothetical protein
MPNATGINVVPTGKLWVVFGKTPDPDNRRLWLSKTAAGELLQVPQQLFNEPEWKAIMENWQVKPRGYLDKNDVREAQTGQDAPREHN